MPLITLGTAEIMAIIAAEEAAAAAAAVTATTAAEAAAAETASQAAAQAAAEQAAQEAARQSAQQGIMQAGTEQAATQAGAQGITQAAPLPPAGAPAPPAAPLTPATTAPPAGQSAQLGLEQVANPDQAMFEELQKQITEESLKTAEVNPGRQYARLDGFDMFNQGPDSLTPAEINKLNYSEFEGGVNPTGNIGSNVQVNPISGAGAFTPPPPVEPVSPFMKAYEYVDKMHPLSKGLGAYGLLSASGALRQEGASPPGQRTFNNPYHFSPNFKGTHPNPNDYQYTPRYPSYASGGITSLAMGGPAPQTNFANPSQSMMGTSQYDMPTDPMNGNISQRMAEGGVTGSGQMQLNVPINVGGAGGGGGGGSPYTPAGGGGYAPPGGPQGHPPGGFDRLGVDKLGGPQGGGSGLGSLADILRGRQDNPLVGPQPMPYGGFNSLQQQQQALRQQMEEKHKGELGYPQQPTEELLGQTQSPLMHDSTNSTTSADMGYKGPIQRGLGGKGGFSQQPADNTGKGMGFAKGGSTTDIYDASLRFANMLDNPSRYTPPDTRFQSVDTFRDTNPNTSTKSPDEAAEIRRKAIEQRSYVNTGAKFPTASRRPGQLDLGPVGGERGKYDNQESVLAAQGGIMGYSLGGYASGGNPRLLRGPGDGMSDNIPATIADRQPARLADGEFVVPADVVSHLGNGSTEAGAKKLHEMMNSVRRARTGNPKQGKKINPNKFMPKK
jgi:hypothetical protein